MSSELKGLKVLTLIDRSGFDGAEQMLPVLLKEQVKQGQGLESMV